MHRCMHARGVLKAMILMDYGSDHDMHASLKERQRVKWPATPYFEQGCF